MQDDHISETDTERLYVMLTQEVLPALQQRGIPAHQNAVTFHTVCTADYVSRYFMHVHIAEENHAEERVMV